MKKSITFTNPINPPSNKELEDAAKRIGDSFAKTIFDTAFFASTSGSAKMPLPNSRNLTYENLMIALGCKTLRYAMSEHVEQNSLLHIPETESQSEYIVFHPDNSEEIKKIADEEDVLLIDLETKSVFDLTEND